MANSFALGTLVRHARDHRAVPRLYRVESHDTIDGIGGRRPAPLLNLRALVVGSGWDSADYLAGVEPELVVAVDCDHATLEAIKADESAWSLLAKLPPFVDEDGAPMVELANCVCGSTLAREVAL